METEPRMKIKILLGLFLTVQGYSLNEEFFFNQVQGFFQKEFPQKFSCEIQGDSLTKSIANLPKEAVVDKSKLKITLLFHRKYGSRVILSGVIGAFKDRFSYIENIFEFILPFVQKENYQKFAEKYQIYDIRESSFKLKKKLTSGNYLEIILNKNMISSIKEYKDQKLIINTLIEYEKKETYWVPFLIKVFYYEENQLKILKFNLNYYNLNPKIEEDDFLG
jgi:hypothetical protein